MMTTFALAPMVVAQMTPAKRPSTRSLHGSASSSSGGPVQVLEVEADNIMTPTVEIESPSRSRVGVRGSDFTPSYSTLTPFDLQQKHESYFNSQTGPYLPQQLTSKAHSTAEHPHEQLPTVAKSQEIFNNRLSPSTSITQRSTLPRNSKAHPTTILQTAILHTSLSDPHAVPYNPTETQSTSTFTTNPTNIKQLSLTIPKQQNTPSSQCQHPTNFQKQPLTSPVRKVVTLSRLALEVHSAPDLREYQTPFNSQAVSLRTPSTVGGSEKKYAALLGIFSSPK